MSFIVWWEDPWFLLLLLALPLMLWRTLSLTKPGRVPVSSDRWLRAIPHSPVAYLWWAPDALRMLAVTVLVVAAARPQTVEERLIAGKGVDIMVALDMSISMNAVDMAEEQLDELLDKGEKPRNRFEAAREILKSFIASRSHDRIGLVIFGPQAWLKYPLTLDYERLVGTLDELVLDSGYKDRLTKRCSNGCTIEGDGTAIGDALGRAYNRLRRSETESKLVILITDGKQEAGKLDPRAIARHLRDLPEGRKVRVYTFLVGSKDQTWRPQVDFRGDPLVNASGVPLYEPMPTGFPVDPQLLAEIADMTGAQFYRSYNEDKFKEDIKDLERRVFSSEVLVNKSDIFLPFLYIGFFLLMLEWALRFTLFRSIA